MGRKSKSNIILDNLELIKELKARGIKDLQIAKRLKLAPATWYKYLDEIPELKKVIEDGEEILVEDLVNELVRKAKPHTLTTTKTVTTNDKVVTEVVEKEVDGDLGALIFLLKNRDSENWSNEPQMLKLKKQELELKEKNAEFQNF